MDSDILLYFELVSAIKYPILPAVYSEYIWVEYYILWKRER